CRTRGERRDAGLELRRARCIEVVAVGERIRLFAVRLAVAGDRRGIGDVAVRRHGEQLRLAGTVQRLAGLRVGLEAVRGYAVAKREVIAVARPDAESLVAAGAVLRTGAVVALRARSWDGTSVGHHLSADLLPGWPRGRIAAAVAISIADRRLQLADLRHD